MFNRNKLTIIAGLTQHNSSFVDFEDYSKFFKNYFATEGLSDMLSYLAIIGRKTNSFDNNNSINVKELCYNIKTNLLS